MTHVCVGNLIIIGSDNGLSPGRHQAITWTNVGILLIGPLGTIFSEMLIEIHTFSFKKIHLKMWSGKWRPFCLGLNVLSGQCNIILWNYINIHHIQSQSLNSQWQTISHPQNKLWMRSLKTLLTHWSLEDEVVILSKLFSNSYQGYMSWAFPVKLPSDEWHEASLMINQHWLRY